MTKDRNTEELGQCRKRMPEWQKWVIAYAITGGIVWWVSSMPIQFYHPYCGPGPERWPREYYGASLSTYYREALISGLQNSDIPYLKIGDRVLVPFVNPGYSDDRKGGLERLVYLILDDPDDSWGSTHLKVSSSAVYTYATEYPDSEIAELREKKFAQFYGGPELSYDERDALDCELMKRIVDPNLK